MQLLFICLITAESFPREGLLDGGHQHCLIAINCNEKLRHREEKADAIGVPSLGSNIWEMTLKGPQVALLCPWHGDGGTITR